MTMPSHVPVRDAEHAELDRLAEIWHDGWHDAHAAILPPALAAMRTLESFRHRLEGALADTRVIGLAGDPDGFSMLKGAELYQLYVAARARGTGAAAALIDDAETRIAARGERVAWLACAVGNERAARFYEKRGWRRVGTVPYEAETSIGPFLLEVWRYEKVVARTADGFVRS
jgi:ribosomal protein S18 acetylase RimI-like enzyme